jgi:hypothetical protein
MFTFREKLSQVSPVPEDYNDTLSPLCVATVYIINLLEVEAAGVSPSEHPA